MMTNVQKTMPLGELVTAAFDKAARDSNDPREVSRMATQALSRMLQRGLKTYISHSPPTICA